jgi:multiple sugar transport system permease protein
MPRVVLYTLVVLIVLWSGLPFLGLVVFSFSRSVDLVSVPPHLIPNPPTLENYRSIFATQIGTSGLSITAQMGKVPAGLINSLIVAISVTLINLVIGVLAGYGYARYSRFLFMRSTLQLLMITRMIPGLTIIVPWFIMFRAANLLDTRWALIITYTSFILPLTVWILRGYFLTVPRSLEDAALVDGCGRLRAFAYVVLPVALPGIIAAGIFCFLVCWNEFLFALNLTGTTNAQTIPVVLAGLALQMQQYIGSYGSLFAAGVVAVLPPVLIAFGLQRYLVQGMLSGSAKA